MEVREELKKGVLIEKVPELLRQVVIDPTQEKIISFWNTVYSQNPILGFATNKVEKITKIWTWVESRRKTLYDYLQAAFYYMSAEDFIEFFSQALNANVPQWFGVCFNLECLVENESWAEGLHDMFSLRDLSLELVGDDALACPWQYEYILGLTSYGSFAYPKYLGEYIVRHINIIDQDRLSEEAINKLWEVLTNL